MSHANDWQMMFDRDGFVVVSGVLTPGRIAGIVSALEGAFQRQADNAAIRTDAGNVYAARNVLEIWPEAASVWRQPPLPEMLEAVLSPDFGLVRTLYFDKPPDRTWALPWHKDLTIAVRDNHRPSTLFGKPTVKAGVPHVEAPEQVLEAMVTLRIHLDEVTEENGPLLVVPGSQRTGKALQLGDKTPRTLLAKRGEVLMIRPLVAHSSVRSHPKTRSHRRILHLEFAASPELPDGYCWHDFRPGRAKS
jgi:hypothetical protein